MEPSSSSSSLMKYGATISYRAVEDDDRTSISTLDDDETTVSHFDGKPPSTKEYFASEVDGLHVAPLLIGYAFMTGYIDAISFSTIFVWCGFQTGNFAQVALALATTLESHFLAYTTPTITHIPLSTTAQQAICSLVSFLLGLAIFGRLGDKIGPHKRGWLFFGTLFQAFLTLLSAVIFWRLSLAEEGNVSVVMPMNLSVPKAGNMSDLEYFFGVACLSASFGVQGIMARRLNSYFGTTVVLTGVFVDLLADPTLLQVTRPVRSRDEMWVAVLSLFCGVVVGRLVLGQLGTPLTIGVGALIRAGIAFGWLCVPATHVHLP